MHNAAFAALGLNWRYVACRVDPRSLRTAIAGAQTMGFAGLNLTVPHKVLALDMVDALDTSAKVWGAVNTIRFEGRSAQNDWLPLREFTFEPPVEVRSVGFNTDADGLINALREDLQLEVGGKRVLLLGAGGAGRSAALKLVAEGASVLYLVNRTFSKILELQAEIRQNFPKACVALNYPADRTTKLDLVLNATSLGLKPEDGLRWTSNSFPCHRRKPYTT